MFGWDVVFALLVSDVSLAALYYFKGLFEGQVRIGFRLG